MWKKQTIKQLVQDSRGQFSFEKLKYDNHNNSYGEQL